MPDHHRVTGNGLGAAALLLASLGLATSALAADEGDGADKDASLPAYTEKGADTCLKCHGGEEEPHVSAIMKGPHGVIGDEDTPFAGSQCEACHGPGGDHAARVRFGEERPPMPAFGANSLWSEERENRICADCHRSQAHGDWAGSVHQRQDVACADCHEPHARRDPVTVTSRQPEVCFDCHVEQKAQASRAYAHPLRHGQMDCAACHEPHGSLTEDMLARPTLNQTCYECHAEKRGPHLWEHAPVTEDCTLCHRPHGSNHEGLLTQRSPLLCQQCHSRLGHPSIGRTGNDLPSGSPSPFLLSRGCTNCHTQVHGSNHPSGSNLTR